MNLRHIGFSNVTFQQIASTGLVLVLIMTAAAPQHVLAFEAKLPVASATALVARADFSGRDPYLARAIESLPDYHYVEAGTAVATMSPVTEYAVWKKPTPQPKPEPVHPFVVAQGTAPTVTEKAPVIVENPAPGEPVLVLTGEASYYSRAGCLGCDPAMIMANGQPLNDNALTMAIGAHLKHLVGHQARVTSLATGKSVTVRITDTGGFYQARYGHRVADLTVATKNAIGMPGGTGQVKVEVF